MDASTPVAVAGRARLRPATAAATVIVAVALAAGLLIRYGLRFDGVVAAAGTMALVALSRIDVQERRLPNAVVLPTFAAVLGSRLIADASHWSTWVLATFVPAAVALVVAVAARGGLGMGDVKLVLVVGALLGHSVVAGLAVGTLAASLFAVLLVARKGRSARGTTIAYGPFLALGTVVMLFVAMPGS